MTIQRLSFTFREAHSLHYGLYLSRWPALPTLKRRVHFVDIPGRSSSIWYDEKTYEDYTLLVDCVVSRRLLGLTIPDFISHLDAVRDWLYGPDDAPGISDLVFSFQPARVHQAQVIQPFDFDLISGQAVTFSVAFICRAPENGGV